MGGFEDVGLEFVEVDMVGKRWGGRVRRLRFGID